MKKVLLVSTTDNAPTYSDRSTVLKTLKSYLAEVSIDTSDEMIENLTFTIINNHLRIILRNGEDISKYDLVYIKNWRAHEGPASAVTVYLNKSGKKTICSELQYFRATDKIIEAFMLVAEGIPYPDTLYTVTPNELPIQIEKYRNIFSYPLIVKAIDGSAGEDNYLIASRAELESLIENSPKVKFMAQNMIENDGDHRIVIMGDEPVLAFKRTRQDNSTHLNNTSKGASAKLVDLNLYSRSIINDATKAARILRREIAGVDILINKHTDKHVILEVNASPQLSTGAFLDEKKNAFQQYILKELKDI